jgi:5'(3')-deoxyribonucleotidase
MKLVIDMDEVIVDFMGPLLREYNRRHGADLGIEDITEWQLPPEMIEIFKEPFYFLGLPPLPGAIDGMRYLRQAGHDVIIATSPSELPRVAADKLTWVKIWLPEYVQDLHIVHRKDRLIGDLLCDDCTTYLTAFRGTSVAMDRPWNRSYQADRRVWGWHDLIPLIDRTTALHSGDSATYLDLIKRHRLEFKVEVEI